MSQLSRRAISFVSGHRAGLTKLKAAKNASITIKTAEEYLSSQRVKEALAQASQDELVSLAAASIGMMAAMLETLRDIALDPAVHHSNRVGAAKSVLEHALKLREVQQLADRVEELETLLAEYLSREEG